MDGFVFLVKKSLILVLILCAGCAFYSNYYKGQRALEQGNLDTAIAFFESALKTSPGDPRILTELGVACFRKGDYQQASQYLTKAKSFDPKYNNPYLYLGMIYEKQDDFPKAISEYNSYCQLSPLTPSGRRVKARIGVLIRNQIARDIQVAIKQEESLSVDRIPENTIAVLYFSNLTGRDELTSLQKGLTDMLITDLSKVRSLKVLERTRLQLLMDELKLSATGIVDPSTAPRVGKLLGARRLINGGLALPQADLFRIDAVSTNIATTRQDAQASVSGKQDRFFIMEKELVFGILSDLGVSIAPQERDAIRKVPTESFMAFLAYSRGLDYEDRGLYQDAAKEFQNAVQIDPGFSLADQRLGEAQELVEAPMTGSSQETAQLEQAVDKDKVVAREELISAVADRLDPIGRNSTEGFIPELAGRTPPQQLNTTTLSVTVEW